MRWTRLALSAFAALVGAQGAFADDDPPAPPANPAEPAWKREANDLEKRATEAADKQDLETALALRRKALVLVRENLKGDHPDVAGGLSSLANTLDALGRPADALPPFEEALAIRRRLFRGDHPDVATSLNDVAVTLDALGRPVDALPLKEEALAMRRRLWKGDHPDVATSLGNLAYTLDALGRSADALPLKEKALAMVRRLWKGDHPEVATHLNNVAYTLGALGRPADALPLFEEALAMVRRLFQGDHPSVAAALNSLAYTLGALGRPADALPLQEEALAMRRRLFQGDHPNVAMSLGNLASTLDALGRSADALPLQEEALAMFRRILRGDHPHVATSLGNLAYTLEALGRSADAFPLREEALAMRRRLSEGDHPDVATSLNNLASTHDDLGRPADALPLKEEALAMVRRLFQGDHPSVATSLNNVGVTLDTLGRPADALPLKEEALAMVRRLWKGDHPEVATHLNNVAYTLGALGRPADALPLFEEALAMIRRLWKGDHPSVATALNSLAFTLDALGRPADAFPLREEALAMRRRLWKGDHPDVAQGLNNLAYTLVALGRPADALPLYEEALAMRRRLWKGDHPDVALGLNNLASTLGAVGRSADALPLYEQAFAIAERLASPDRYQWGTNLGSALLRSGRAKEALAPLATAVTTFEWIRSQARGLRSEQRSRLVESLRDWGDPYAFLLRAHVALGDASAAFGTLERGRGREMLDLLLRGEGDPVALAKARAKERGDVDALRRLDEVEAERAMAEAEVVRRAAAADRARGRTDATLVELRTLSAAEAKARHDLLDVLARVQGLVKDALPEARALSPTEAQALLAPDERLLAYSLGEDASYAFVVSPAGIEVVLLEADGRPLTARAVAELAFEFRDALADRDADLTSVVVAKGRDLFRKVVPPKAWAAVRAAARVYLMPHGALNAIPFETLVVGDEAGKPLFWTDVGPPLAYEPSASVLSSLAARPRSQGTGKDLVALGDPVFAGSAAPASWPETGVLVTDVRPDGQAAALGLRPGDVLVAYDRKDVVDPAALRARVREAGDGREGISVSFLRDGERREVRATSGLLGIGVASEPPTISGPRLLEGGPLAIALRSAAARGRSLARLPGTRVEVKAIADAFLAARGAKARVTMLLGREATESELFEATRSPRCLHLATHGLVDETETASFSALALSMPAVPVAGDDGFLTLVDLFQRWQGRLKGTDLVVLSACQSTKGKAGRDEVMYALPWGFLFAGARSVVGSLWKVDDDSTAFLMAEFYRRLLATDGRDPLAALAAARLATKAKYPHPYFWGPFVLSGAPR